MDQPRKIQKFQGIASKAIAETQAASNGGKSYNDGMFGLIWALKKFETLVMERESLCIHRSPSLKVSL